MKSPAAAIGAAAGALIGLGIVLGAVFVEQLSDAAVAVLRWSAPRWRG